MAYSNLLASVPMGEVERLQGNPSFVVGPTLVLPVSHLLAYWITIQPLGGLLGQALDGGQLLSPVFWHPFRVPVYHKPPVAAELFRSLSDTWRAALAEHPVDEDDWLPLELNRLLKVFGTANERGEAVVSALGLPFDQERAGRCRLPWQPIPPPELVITSYRSGRDRVSSGIRRWLIQILTLNSSKRS